MNQLREQIENIYNTKKILRIFLVLILIFLILGLIVKSKSFWIIGDFLWWIFLGLGVFNAIYIARKSQLEYVGQVLENRMELEKNFIIERIDSELRINRIKEITEKLDHQTIYQMGLDEMIRLSKRVLLPFKSIIDEINDGKFKENWSEIKYEELINILSYDRNESTFFKNTTNRLRYRVNVYHELYKEYQEIKTDSTSRIAKTIIQITPFLLIFLISFQIGKNFHLLLEIIKG